MRVSREVVSEYILPFPAYALTELFIASFFVSHLVEVTLHHYFVARGVFSDKLAGYL